MKIPRCSNFRLHVSGETAGDCPARTAARPRERGSVVLVVLVLLAIVFIYLTANVRTLHYLGRDLQLLERQQIRRLAGPRETTGHRPTSAAVKAEAGAEKAGK